MEILSNLIKWENVLKNIQEKLETKKDNDVARGSSTKYSNNKYYASAFKYIYIYIYRLKYTIIIYDLNN